MTEPEMQRLAELIARELVKELTPVVDKAIDVIVTELGELGR